MRKQHKNRQRELFGDDPPTVAPTLPPQAREEALALLRLWLHALSEAVASETDDE